ncbi:hypothetical protein PTKIN_Ptkin06aG0077300 [Pterospermum kingtungense]
MALISDSIENIKLIDTLCRLVVSYHFETEIEEILKKNFDSLDSKLVEQNDYDLNITALIFRVFRQHGFKMGKSQKCILEFCHFYQISL